MEQELFELPRDMLKEELIEVSYKTWIDPIIPVKLDGNVIYLETSSPFPKVIVDARYSSLIKRVISQIALEDYEVNIGLLTINYFEN